MSVHNPELLTLFETLVGIYSPTGQEAKIATFLSDYWSNTIGIRPLRDNHQNVYLQIAGQGEPLFLSAHMDTVEPSRDIKLYVDKDGYVRSKTDTILGADNKLALACIIAATKYAAENPKRTRPIDVLVTTSEEQGNYGALGFDYSQLRAKSGFVFDASFPVGTIIKSSPFYARFDFTIVGKAAHAGYPNLATPVIPSLVDIVSKVELLRRTGLLVTMGLINGGSARNTIMGEITINGEVRSLDKSLFYKTVSKLEKISLEDQSCHLDRSVVVENDGYVHSSKLLKQVHNKLSKISNQPIAQMATQGVSDANIFNAKGLTVVNLGDGTIDSHTVNERFHLSDMEKLYRLIRGLMFSSEQE